MGALGAFEDEMKKQGMWENVTVVVVSEFGRTITTNGRGTDHGWGGHAFIAGGGLDGGRILGTYPSNLGDDSELSAKRGRVIPTTPWEGLWKGVAEWYGVG